MKKSLFVIAGLLAFMLMVTLTESKSGGKTSTENDESLTKINQNHEEELEEEPEAEHYFSSASGEGQWIYQSLYRFSKSQYPAWRWGVWKGKKIKSIKVSRHIKLKWIQIFKKVGALFTPWPLDMKGALASKIIGTLRNYNGDVNRNFKKATCLKSKTKLFVDSPSSLYTDCDVKWSTKV